MSKKARPRKTRKQKARSQQRVVKELEWQEFRKKYRTTRPNCHDDDLPQGCLWILFLIGAFWFGVGCLIHLKYI